VLEPHLDGCVRKPEWLERIGRAVGLPRVDWNVAVPRPQHSAMFGQRASSQIVWRLAPWMSFWTSK
jgi:hypothetical protein